LIDAHKRGLEVVVRLDGSYDYQDASGAETLSRKNDEAYLRLSDAGIDCKYAIPTKTLHDKLLVIDEEIVIEGSMNWLSRALGLYRDRLLAGTFGAGASLDIYFTAFRIPDLIHAVLVTGGLSATFLPIFSEEFEKSEKKAFLFANNLINLSLIFLGGLCLLSFFLLPLVEDMVAPGFDAGQKAELMGLTRIV